MRLQLLELIAKEVGIIFTFFILTILHEKTITQFIVDIFQSKQKLDGFQSAPSFKDIYYIYNTCIGLRKTETFWFLIIQDENILYLIFLL